MLQALQAITKTIPINEEISQFPDERQQTRLTQTLNYLRDCLIHIILIAFTDIDHYSLRICTILHNYLGFSILKLLSG